MPTPDKSLLIFVSSLVFETRGDKCKGGMSLEVRKLELRGGDIAALIGPSGCGKSVLLCTLMGYPAFGVNKKNSFQDFSVFGHNVAKNAFAAYSLLDIEFKKICNKGRLFYLPQSFPQPRTNSVSTLEAMAQIYQSFLGNSKTSKRCAEDDIKKLFSEKFRLSEQLNKPLMKLSGGERRRVELAVRLGAIEKLKMQSLLLLDEPTTGFDPLHTTEFTKLIKDGIDNLNKNGIDVAAIYSTHSLDCIDRGYVNKIVLACRDAEESKDEEREITDDSGISDFGRCSILFDGTPNELKSAMGFDETFSFMAHSDLLYEKLMEKRTESWQEHFRLWEARQC